MRKLILFPAVLSLIGCAEVNRPVITGPDQDVSWNPVLHSGITHYESCDEAGKCTRLVDGKDRTDVMFTLNENGISYQVGASIGSTGQAIVAELLKALDNNDLERARVLADLLFKLLGPVAGVPSV